MKAVLILTAGFGEGHNAAARNVAEALSVDEPQLNVHVADVYAEAYGRVNQISVKGYQLLINRLPKVWQGVFEVMDRTTWVPDLIGVFQGAAKRLESLLEEINPSVVVSTYPGNNFLLDYVLKKRVRRGFKTVTVITDSITVNMAWLQGFSDYLIVANAPTAKIVQKLGAPEEKIKELGFPVPRWFAEMKEPKVAQEPWRVLYTINSGKHLAGGIVEALLELPNVELTVTVGKDEALGAELREIGARKGRDFTILGWVKNMPELMATHHVLIGKAGGATVQETLAAGTPMVITQVVPGQEEGNARLVLENHAGCVAEEASEIVAAVSWCFTNEGKQWQLWAEAARKLGTPRGALEVAAFVRSLL